jgi:hypothetical protein
MTTPREEFAPAPDASAFAPAPQLGTVPRDWSPDNEGIIGHAGQPLTDEWVFPVSPPPEIGPIRTAGTTVRAHTTTAQRTMPRIKGFFGGAALGAAVIFLLSRKIDRAFGHPYAYVIGIMVGALIGLVKSAHRLTCTFVGAEGVASFLLDARTYAVKSRQGMLFRGAAVLRVKQTHHYVNGSYSSTDYEFAWQDAAGVKRFEVKGRYSDKNGTPSADSSFYFAQAAEAAWTDYMLAASTERLARGESVRFPLKGANYVEVGPQILELRVGSKSDRMERDDIGTINVELGEVIVSRKDAKAGFLGMGAQGIFKFSYGDLANARLFFALLGHAFAAENAEGGSHVAPAFALAQTATRDARQAEAVKQGAGQQPAAAEQEKPQ